MEPAPQPSPLPPAPPWVGGCILASPPPILQAQDHPRRKTCPCSWNQVTSGCKLAYQKPKGRVTSRVREAVAVSRVEMMNRERGRLSRGMRGGTVVGDGRGTGLPSADTRPAENRPGMGRRLGWGDARDGETPGMGRRLGWGDAPGG